MTASVTFNVLFLVSAVAASVAYIISGSRHEAIDELAHLSPGGGSCRVKRCRTRHAGRIVPDDYRAA